MRGPSAQLCCSMQAWRPRPAVTGPSCCQVVTKKQHAVGVALFKKIGQRWLEAVTTARKELGIKGFCPVGGKSAQGKALYAKAKALYAA